MKEMKSVHIAFLILCADEKPAVGSQFMQYHMIFDTRMEDFRLNAILVMGAHMMEVLKTLTYASIVQIALMIAELNDLEVKMVDVQNAFLPCPVLN